MSSEQLLLDLPTRTGLARADFFAASSNRAALNAVDGWRDWPAPRLLITGPDGSGRSHLLHIWASDTNACVVPVDALREPGFVPPADAVGFAIDDAENVAGSGVAEEALFHLYNFARHNTLPLLLTARSTPGTWGLTLPDLLSRVQACHVTQVMAPDDELLRMVLIKLCDERQLAVDDDIVRYLIPRMERSLRAAHQIVEALDKVALLRRKRATRTMAADVLAEMDSACDTN